MRRLTARCLVALIAGFGLLSLGGSAELPEYELKAAFLYNFAQFTEWPTSVGRHLNLCTYGGDPFGASLDELEDKQVGQRTLQLRRRVTLDAIEGCQILYVGPDAIGMLGTLRKTLARRPVLIVADSPGAAALGATINMTVAQNRISFEANRVVARDAGLELSSRLLRLATQVIQ